MADTDGALCGSLVALDDVFEQHAHAYQRAVRRRNTQPRTYRGRPFADCPTTTPPEIELGDPMLGLPPGDTYVQEWAVYTLGAEACAEQRDYFCFINAVSRVDSSAAAALASRALGH